MRNKFIGKEIISSICIAGLLVSLIIISNLIFDLFKVWLWSIQVFLIIYAIGIYKIKNMVVNICFIICVPPILFGLEKNIWSINFIQVFFEYFLVIYIFSFFLILRIFTKKLKYHWEVISFIGFLTLLIFVKYFLHSIATMTWWDKKNFGAALTYNIPWLVTNLIIIPIAIFITFPTFKLFNKYYENQKNKW